MTGCIACGARGKKSICCDQKLCAAHETAHDCPRAAQLLAMGPKQIAQWKKDNAHETSLTTKVLERLKLEPGLIAWRTKIQPGAREGNANEGVPDISGFAAPDGRAFFIETKASHPAICNCKPCKGQREFGHLVRAAGGVALENVRSAADVVEKLRTELARVRVPGVAGGRSWSSESAAELVVEMAKRDAQRVEHLAKMISRTVPVHFMLGGILE